MTDPTIYLAGPVEAYDDGGATWRNAIKNAFDEFEFRDPVEKYNVRLNDLELVDGHSDTANPRTVGVDELVEEDLRLLRESDGVLVGYTAVKSIGTPMEVMWARERNYPVAIWVRDETPLGDLSPWYRYHGTALTTDAELALRHIRAGVGEVTVDV